MLISLVLILVAIIALATLWNAMRERRVNRLPPPLVFSPYAPQSLHVTPRAPLAPTSAAVAQASPTPVSAPAQLRVVRDRPVELAVHREEPVSDETVRFRRPADEAVQLLPGRLEVLEGEPRQREIRFVRVPGRPAELVLGREPGDSPQHVALSSTTVSRRHARFAFLDGGWTVANLSRTNPIVINGHELLSHDAVHELHDGDRLELGEVVLRFTSNAALR